MSSTWLITGANRGIGFGLASLIAARPDTTLIACVRDLAKSSDLQNLPTAANTRIIVLQMDASSPESVEKATARLVDGEHISTLDVVIANAGISQCFDSAIDTPHEQFLAHFQTNTLGPVALLRATKPLLQCSRQVAKFVAISSMLGSIGMMDMVSTIQTTAYGCSKAALNFWLRKVHFEEPELCVLAINPGYVLYISFVPRGYNLTPPAFLRWVATEAGNAGARSVGMDAAPVSIGDSCRGLIGVVSARS